MAMTSSITASGRNFFLASALSAALLLAAPAISQAAEGFTINTSGTTASGTTQSGFGSAVQGLLPSSTVTLYVWTNQASGGFANSSTRRIAFDLNFNTAVFEQSGGSCSSQTPAAGFTYRGALSYSGSGNRTCTVILRVKAGAAVGVVSNSMNWAQAASGTACNGGTCAASSSGSTTSGTTILAATVAANAPAVQIWNSGNTALEASHAYPDTVSGLSSSNYSFTVKNTGNVPVSVPNAQALSGTNSSDFAIVSTTCGATLAVAATCSIVTKFVPSDVGARSATLTVTPTYAGTGYPTSASLSGTGLAQTRLPGLFDGASPATSHDFGSIGLGAIADYSVTLTNNGNWPVAGTNTFNFSGANASDFTVNSTTCGSSLAAGASCTITIRFVSSSAGSRVGVMEVGTSDETAGGDATIALAGFAEPPTFIPAIYDTLGTTLAPSHAFADTVATLLSPAYTFTLANDGNARLEGVGAANQLITGADSAEFTKTTNCPTNLEAGLSCTITVRFAPPTGSSGAKTAALEVQTTNGDPLVVSTDLTATAILDTRVPQFRDTANANTLTEFELPAAIRTQSSNYVFTLKNDGNTTLNGTGAAQQTITGADAGQFSKSTTCSASIAAGASCTITVTFSPTTNGAKSANLVLTATDSTVTNPLVLPITGPVTPDTPELTIFDSAGTSSKVTHDYGIVDNGSSSAYTFTVKNTGNVPVATPSTQTFTGVDAAQFSKTTTCAASLAVNATCTVTVTFTPNDTSQFAATLNVTGSVASKSVSLSARGGGVLVKNSATANLRGLGSQKLWLDSPTVGGAAPINSSVRVAFDVAVEQGHTIEDVLVSSTSTTNDTAPGTFSPVPGGVAEIYQAPGGSTRAYVVASMPITSLVGWTTGLGNTSFLGLGAATARTTDRRIWFKLKDDQGKLSTALGTQLGISDATWAKSVLGTGSNGIPLLDAQTLVSVGGVPASAGTKAAITTPGTSVTYSFKGNRDNESYGFRGIRWRIRNSATGAMFVKTGQTWLSCAAPCTSSGFFSVANGSQIDAGNPSVGVTQQITTSFPSRGRWVVEGIALGSSQDDSGVQYIGQAIVNEEAGSTTASSPTISISGEPPARPATDASYTITATLDDPSSPVNAYDSLGGKAAIIEWDLDNNPTNGPAGDGFEDRVAKPSGLPATAIVRTLDLSGKAPGEYTIRARVTDNGAFNGSDPARASKIYSKTFTINSPPQGTDQTVIVEADQNQPKSITLAGTDANDDPLTFDVPAGGPATTGALTGSDSARSYTWPANYSGTDSFPFTTADDKNAGGTGTLTVRVRPNTAIDTAEPSVLTPTSRATRVRAASFSFSTTESPSDGFDCRLLRNGTPLEGEDWAACDSASKSYSDLGDGVYRFETRTRNGDLADGTPASYLWRVDNTAPLTEIDSTPPSDRDVQPRPTNDTTPTYGLRIADESPQSTATYECKTDFGSNAGQWLACGQSVQLAGAGTIFGQDDPLGEGTYHLDVRATDEVGITGPVLGEDFLIDTAKPDTSIASGPDGLINTREITLAVTSTEPFSTFRCELTKQGDGTIFAQALCPTKTIPGGSAPNFTGLADGFYALTIEAIDPATNVDANPAVANFELDATPPQTTLDAGPPARTQSRSAAIEFGGTDSRQMRGFECRRDSTDDEDWAPCQSPESYGGFSDGEHKIEIRSIDDARNVDPTPLQVVWVVDRTAPTTTISAKPNAVDNAAVGSFSFSVSEESTSSCSVDGGAYAACASPFTTAALPDGTHTVSIRSTDLAGNVEATVASYEWRVDTLAPDLEYLSFPLNPSPDGPARATVEVTEGGLPAPEVLIECVIDPADMANQGSWQWDECDSPWEMAAPSNGTHHIAFRAVDSAGNASAAKVHTWAALIDPPAAPTIDSSEPSAGAVTRSTRAIFSFSHPDATGLVFDCRLDGGAWNVCDSSEAPVALNGLADGDHTFSVRARDAVNNVSQTVSRSWEVSTSAPSTTITAGPAALSRQANADLRFTSDRPGTFQCRVDGSPWESCTSPKSLVGLADGEHSLVVRAISDVRPVGVKDPTPVTRRWTVDATAPQTTITSAPASNVDVGTARLAFDSDDSQARFECRLDTGEFDTCNSPVELAGLGEGVHTFNVRAVDAAGNTDSEPAEAAWTVAFPVVPVDPDPGQPTGGSIARLTGGSLGLAALGTVPLPADQITIAGEIGSNGAWTAPQNSIRFKPVSQDVDAPGIGALKAKIILSATGPGTGQLTPGGGAASFTVPVQAKLEVSLGGAPLLGPTSQCFLRPIEFDLGGSWSASAKTVTVGSASVAFPRVSAGCGGLGDTVNNLLELPRSDIAISLSFALGENIAPQTTITAKPNAPSPTASFAFSSDQSSASFECKLDAGEWEACTSPKAYSTAAAGAHAFAVRAVNEYGAPDLSPATAPWTRAGTASFGTISGSVGAGKLNVPVRCASGACAGRVVLKTKVGSAVVTVGSADWTLASGASKGVVVSLTSRGASLLKAAGRKGLSATVELLPTGATTAIVTKTVKLKAASRSARTTTEAKQRSTISTTGGSGS